MRPVIYQVSEICRDVRIALDQNAISDQLLNIEDRDTLSLDEIIKSKITDAVRIVEMNAPLSMLDAGYNFGSSIYWDNTTFCGYTVLPNDFMRLLIFEMSDWERPVFYAIDETGDEYLKQHSRRRGIRGTTEKPVCAITLRSEGRVLEFFSCDSNSATVRRAAYLPYPKIDDNDGVEICERCYRASIYECAALVAQTFNATDAKNELENMVKEVLV